MLVHFIVPAAIRHLRANVMGYYTEVSEITDTLGSVITLECLFDGDPYPSVSWYMNGTKLNEGVVNGDKISMIVVTVMPYNTSYQCVVINKYGFGVKPVVFHEGSHMKGNITGQFKYL